MAVAKVAPALRLGALDGWSATPSASSIPTKTTHILQCAVLW